GRYGRALHGKLAERGFRILGIDFDPDVIRQWRAAGGNAIYGDLQDPDMGDSLPLEGVGLAIIAVPPHELGITHEDPRVTLLESLRRQGFAGRTVAIARSDADMALLRRKGADILLSPFSDAADRAIERIFNEDFRSGEREALYDGNE